VFFLVVNSISFTKLKFFLQKQEFCHLFYIFSFDLFKKLLLLNLWPVFFSPFLHSFRPVAAGHASAMKATAELRMQKACPKVMQTFGQAFRGRRGDGA